MEKKIKQFPLHRTVLSQQSPHIYPSTTRDICPFPANFSSLADVVIASGSLRLGTQSPSLAAAGSIRES